MTMQRNYTVYLGGVVRTVKAESERAAYNVVRAELRQIGGKHVRSILNGRDILKTINGRMFRRVSDLKG
jgi:hypothetical protein